MNDYFFLGAALWAASGVIPSIIFEQWSMCHYGDKPNIWTALRLYNAWYSGPFTIIALAIVLHKLRKNEQ